MAGQIDFFRIEVDAGNSEHWQAVREQFRVGARLPVLALFAAGRWQRTLQGPAPEAVAVPFLTGPLSFDADGNVL